MNVKVYVICLNINSKRFLCRKMLEKMNNMGMFYTTGDGGVGEDFDYSESKCDDIYEKKNSITTTCIHQIIHMT